MNILHISRSMGQGGAEKVVQDLCEGVLDYKNHIVISAGGYRVPQLEAKGIKHIKIDDIGLSNPIKLIKVQILIYKLIKKYEINVIHSHHRMGAFLAQNLSVFFPNIRLIYTGHNIFKNKKSLLRYSLKNTLCVAVGEGVAKNLREFYKVDSNSLEIINNSVEPPKDKVKLNPELAELKLEGFRLIGIIGRLEEQKGIDIFLNSIPNIDNENQRNKYIVIGMGSKLNDLKELAINLKIEQHVIFLGFKEDIYSCIKLLDFIVLSSRWEGFPLTPIEAFAAGKTVIASDISGNNEIIKDNYNGLLFETENSEMLSVKINEILSSEKLLSYLEDNAKKSYDFDFSFEKFLDLYQKLYIGD